MPWNGTQLYLGEVAQNGAISELEPIAGGTTESIFQPEWSPDGTQIVFVSDRSGWWNLYSLDLATRAMRALAPMAAEFGLPQWLLGMSTYAFAGPERIVCTYSQGGLGRLAVLDLANETLTLVATPFTEWAIVLCFAQVRPTIPPASWHSILGPVGTPC
jgi:Tol biopolymer transport system component